VRSMASLRDEIGQQIAEAAKRVYTKLGAGHDEAVYREAMSVELQERGCVVKTEMPVTVKYETTEGKEVAVGSGRIDLYIKKEDEQAIVEIKAVLSLIGQNKRWKLKPHVQLRRYLYALHEGTGFLINFPFPPKGEPEIIYASDDSNEYKAYSVEEIRRKYPNAYAKWTDEEERRLRTEYNRGKVINELARTFGRKPGAIRSRLLRLGLLDFDDHQ